VAGIRAQALGVEFGPELGALRSQEQAGGAALALGFVDEGADPPGEPDEVLDMRVRSPIRSAMVSPATTAKAKQGASATSRIRTRRGDRKPADMDASLETRGRDRCRCSAVKFFLSV
jgi:hypothetical protein